MITTFYAPLEAIRNGYIELPEEEARHAVRVLRMRAGDPLVVVDGAGGWYHAELVDAGKRRAVARVIETRRDVGEPAFDLTLGVALLKNRNRFETALEKAVELGVRRIMPLVTARTVKGGLKMTRSENILIAAMKQSGRCRLVDLAAPTPFEMVLHADVDLGLIAHEQARSEQEMLHVLQRCGLARRIQVLIGPEGGFTDEEIARAQAAGYRVVSLGARRLRAETAALAAVSALMLWGETASATSATANDVSSIDS